MHWESWQQFWAMGGSGSFVWSAYGMTAVVFAVEIFLVRSRARRALERMRVRVDSGESDQ